MYDLGLSAAERREFDATLRTSHRVRVTMIVRNRNEAIVAGLRPRILSGSVQVDADAEIRRSLNAVFLDPEHKLAFDAVNPGDGAMYADNFLEVKYGVYLETSNRWIDVPVFWGPVTGFSRLGPEVTIEAQGKEALVLDPHFVVNGYTIHKGATVENAIRDAIGRTGERRFSLSPLSGRLVKARAVTQGESPWRVCVGGGQDANGNAQPGLIDRAGGNPYLYYDGAGRLSTKSKNAHSIWAFDGTQLVSQPGFKYDVLAFRNHAEVIGAVRKGSKKHVRGEYTLPATHALSPAALARNGAPRFMSIFLESDALKTEAACRDKARKLVEAVAFEGIEATFDCLPIPHLEELDVVALRTDAYAITFRLRTFTIPLTTDSPMNIGGIFTTRLPRRHRS